LETNKAKYLILGIIIVVQIVLVFICKLYFFGEVKDTGDSTEETVEETVEIIRRFLQF